jgi:phosphoglycerol transferase
MSYRLSRWQPKNVLNSIGKKPATVYVAAIALCLLTLTWVMQLWRADLTVPFILWGGDELFYSLLIKGGIDNGWYLHNRFVGMPTGLDLHDYPSADAVHLLAIRLLSYGTSNWALILNLYFLLGFPLATLTALFVFRKFQVSDPVAVVGSVLFAFLPYHFWRGEGHLFLAAYYLLPLMIMVLLWICTGEPLFGGGRGDDKSHRRWAGSATIMSIVICMAMGSGEVYYAFFAGFFLIIAGVFALAQQRSIRPLLSAGILLALLTLTFLANIAPSIRYASQYAVNNAPQRPPGAAELYGMKITQLVLPVTMHRMAYLSDLKRAYVRGTLVANENDMASLGLIGSLGFLGLIGWLVCGNLRVPHAKLFNSLGVLNIAAVLLATTGGFGALFAFYISPQIRGYNRISIYIGFLSLFAVVLCLEKLARRCTTSGVGRWLWYGVLGLILALGILDQTTPVFVPPYDQVKDEFSSDADFVRRIETLVPPHAMIFQLPYVPFPEGPAIHRMRLYDHLRGYLHSKTLRWSFGAMRFREGDTWQKHMAAKPLGELVEALQSADFHGIYLDRYGYPDQGAEVETSLSALLQTRPLISANQRLVFFGFPKASHFAAPATSP